MCSRAPQNVFESYCVKAESWVAVDGETYRVATNRVDKKRGWWQTRSFAMVMQYYTAHDRLGGIATVAGISATMLDEMRRIGRTCGHDSRIEVATLAKALRRQLRTPDNPVAQMERAHPSEG